MLTRNASRKERLYWTRSGSMRAIRFAVIGLLLFSCSRRQEQSSAELDYPQPRYPRYLVKPTTEDLLRAARIAVRQTSGISPLGKMQSGQTVYVLVQWGQDPDVWEAVKQAWAEKGVKAIAFGHWETIGISKEEFDRISKENAVYGNEGWKELGVFVADYKKFFPEEIQKEFGTGFTNEMQRLKYFPAYLEKHPEMQQFFAFTGGSAFMGNPAAEKEHGHKRLGRWSYIRPIDLMTKAAEFPADVWNLVEEKILRPRPFVAEVSFEDPEGTNLHWTLTPEQAREWSSRGGGGGASEASNHINIYPSPLRSTMRDGGVIVAHGNHTGVYPSMKVTLDRYGAVQSVEGGGRTGELLRMLVNHPVFKEAKFPNPATRGGWRFTSDGFATNPKFIRSMPSLMEGEQQMPNLPERNRAGVQHLAFSDRIESDDPADLAYAQERGFPMQHTAHMHVYFPTAKWKLRDTGEWITIVEKGYVKNFDDAEVRALASRYGDPDLIFRYEWIPSVPGVNVPGDYQKDFAKDPWGWMTAEWKRIQDGTYQYFVEDYSMSDSQVAQNAGRP